MVSCQNVAEHYCMDGKQLQAQYKEYLSDFNNWAQKEYAEDFILYPKNIGYHFATIYFIVPTIVYNDWLDFNVPICDLIY